MVERAFGRQQAGAFLPAPDGRGARAVRRRDQRAVMSSRSGMSASTNRSLVNI